MKFRYRFWLFILLIPSLNAQPTYDVLIKNGTIVDGSGEASYEGDLAINQDTIAAIGDLSQARGKTEIDAQGLVVAPGFINMLSWAINSLIIDGNSQGDIRQGVTLEVFGEGRSYGPLNEEMKEGIRNSLAEYDPNYEVPWTSLGEYLEYLENKGVAPNVASFVGATTLRVHAIGYDDRPPTPEELEAMKGLVRQAMEEGAMGIGSSLIYTPAFFADTKELIELCKVAAEYEGLYISHMRSESEGLLEAMDELIQIAREAGIRAEIYHLKQSGKENWSKYDQVVAKIDSARAQGLAITTDMYTYNASSTGLTVCLPPWALEGGWDKAMERLRNPEIRPKIYKDMNMRPPEKILLIGFQNDSLKHFSGKTLAEVSEIRGTDPKETVMDLIAEDDSRITSVYFVMSEENLRKQIALPWMSFGSDAGSLATEGLLSTYGTHPRAYGNFARLLGKYVREEGLIPLEEAIYKLTTLPATNLKIKKRGALKTGYFADIALFDPEKIQDHATYEQPHQYATGMVHVFVNGEQVLKDGEHTGALPGRAVRGPGWKGSK